VNSERPILSSETALRVFELDFRDDPRWETFISSHPGALIYHHPCWLEALENEYGQKCVSLACEDNTGQLCAILPLFYTKGLPLKFGRMATGRRLSSLPRTPIAGPLALNQRALATIVEYAIELAGSQPDVQLEIKLQTPDLEKSVDALTCIAWRTTYLTELPPAVEGTTWEDSCENLRRPKACGPCAECRRLRFGNARRQHRVNWAVNKASKLGLEVRDAETEEDLAEWYALYLLTMRHNAVPPRPYRLFRSLWYSSRAKGKMRLLLAEQRRSGQKRIVAGSILLPLRVVPPKISIFIRMTFFRSRQSVAPAERGFGGMTSARLPKITKP
jgi:hypothetical protein